MLKAGEWRFILRLMTMDTRTFLITHRLSMLGMDSMGFGVFDLPREQISHHAGVADVIDETDRFDVWFALRARHSVGTGLRRC